MPYVRLLLLYVPSYLWSMSRTFNSANRGRNTNRPLVHVGPRFCKAVELRDTLQNRECSEGDLNAKATENILLYGEQKKVTLTIWDYGPCNGDGWLRKFPRKR